jgi:hypothetical protein
MQAAFTTFKSNLAAVDYFHTARTLALVFATEKECEDARKQKLRVGDNTFELAAIPAKPPVIRKLTIDRVPSNQPEETTRAIQDAFASYGRVVEIVPLVWEGTDVCTLTWHVTMDAAGQSNDNAPPETMELLGAEILVDIPQVRRVCRNCKAVQHHASCRIGKRQAEAAANRRAQQQQANSSSSGNGKHRSFADAVKNSTNSEIQQSTAQSKEASTSVPRNSNDAPPPASPETQLPENAMDGVSATGRSLNASIHAPGNEDLLAHALAGTQKDPGTQHTQLSPPTSQPSTSTTNSSNVTQEPVDSMQIESTPSAPPSTPYPQNQQHTNNNNNNNSPTPLKDGSWDSSAKHSTTSEW